MGCRRSWPREVLDTILLTTWINGEYKHHRQNVLLDRERSRLPAAQIMVELRKQAETYTVVRSQISKDIIELEKQLSDKRTDYYRTSRIIDSYNRGQDPFAARGEDAKDQEEKRVFIMPCPASGCRGFLSTAYKCGVCDIYTCPDCHELKGADRDGAHTCDSNNVATVRAMKKECKSCPECGTNIYKIEGCSQMFCTNCKTPFDWKTGKKITNGALHNPHYFEYLRATNGGVMPRNPGDIPCAGNLPNAWRFERDILRKYTGIPQDTSGYLYNALNVIIHIQHVEIPMQTNNAEDMDNTEANIKYLNQTYTELRWKQVLQQREKRRIKRDEVRMRYEAFVGACVDIYGRIIAEAGTHDTITKKELATIITVCQDAVKQLLGLRTIFNDGMMELSKRYKCQVMQLGEKNLKRETKKYITGRARRVKKSDGSTIASSDTDNEVWPDEEDLPRPTGNVLVKLPSA